ncbi:MAG: DUF6491 family protein [Phenylobacterium sp.]|uniref:DUF6491 family protein n=1 Tax=Phenylobacterium sp. TaxID=1871053 RepID=UPI0027216724|nr:DUF6491 family protein [Phenylobacterium sp.]MDO9433193.1 DUF6491 family protein [Phenylobacterium sp.]
MKRLLVVTSTVALVAAAFPALAADQAKPETGSQCFRMSQIRNHTKADSQTLYFSVGARDVYRLDMSGACLAGTSSSDPLIMETVGGTDLICRPIDLNLKVKTGNVGVSPCIIKEITKLTPDQVAALPPKVKP